MNSLFFPHPNLVLAMVIALSMQPCLWCIPPNKASARSTPSQSSCWISKVSLTMFDETVSYIFFVFWVSQTRSVIGSHPSCRIGLLPFPLMSSSGQLRQSLMAHPRAHPFLPSSQPFIRSRSSASRSGGLTPLYSFMLMMVRLWPRVPHIGMRLGGLPKHTTESQTGSADVASPLTLTN